MALICISLMANDVEHLFLCLWAVYTSSLEKRLFRFFAHLKSGLFVFLLLSCKGSLYILDTNPIPYQIPNLQTFPPFCGLSFSTQSLGVDIEMGPEIYFNTYEIRNRFRAGDLVFGEMQNFTLTC